MLNKYLSIVLAGLACISSVQAQNVEEVSPTSESAGVASPWRFYGQIGANFGGDTLLKKNAFTGQQRDLLAGEGPQWSLGLEYTINPELAVQASMGLQLDVVTTSDGDLVFSRLPLEVLGLYTVNNDWRVGAGLRRTQNVKLSYVPNGRTVPSEEVPFSSSVGPLFEVQYMLGPKADTAARKFQGALAVRYVMESFKSKSIPKKFSGDHLGLAFNLYY